MFFLFTLFLNSFLLKYRKTSTIPQIPLKNMLNYIFILILFSPKIYLSSLMLFFYKIGRF